jgi:hypothetical protein
MSRQILQILQEGVLCCLRGPGEGDRRGEIWKSLWIERPWADLLPPRRASSSGLSPIHLLAELLALIEPRGVGGRRS